MTPRKIVLSFDESGHLKMDAIGYPDGSCKTSINKLKNLLGREPIESIDKPEASIESYESYETQDW